ncbi:hypothetical protein BH09PSE5_BH09PSE5_06880 [soil metagenome]
MTDTYNPGREQVQITAQPNLRTEQVRNDPNGDVNSLLQALGSDSTQNELARFAKQREAGQLQEQSLKTDWYIQQFTKDNGSGAVSQAQIKGRFPETVPIIAARIAEGIGQQQGKARWADVTAAIANDDSLRLDSGKRKAFLDQKRAEILAEVGTGNDFFGAGLVKSIDAQISQQEYNWNSETAAYHQKVQAEQFSSEIVTAINTGGDIGSALLNLDSRFGKSSSLNPLERNKIAVDTTIDLAFTNDDPKVFDALPQRFLNADTKAALEKAKVQLTDRRFSDYKMARTLREDRRQDDERSAKTNIVAAHARGEPINPADYRNDPTLYAFALAQREAGRLPESESAGNTQSIRNLILTDQTVGSENTIQSLTDKIVGNQNLNPKDRQKLIEELPKLIEGRNLMRDESVRGPIQDRLAPRMSALETSMNGAMTSFSEGRNLRAEVMKGYSNDINRSFQAYLEDTGNWPTGQAKLDLIDRATDRAERVIEEFTRMGGKATDSRAAKPATPSATKPAAIALPRGVTKLN